MLTFGSASFADEKSDIDRVRAEIIKMIPQASSAEIVAAPAPGVYRMQVQGNYAYAYVNGDYVLLGDLYDTKQQVNLGQKASSDRMASLLKDVPTSKMIVYGPEDPKRHITVFTDIDCGYCRKLHLEVPELNAAGIEVRYLAFPRAGVGSASHKKYVSVWCSDDQQTALTSAKAGGVVAAASCANPVEETYKLGQNVGVRGTPTIIFDDGTVTPGYIPSALLIERLGLKTS
jgi:thiol:disulfide interchange protein DsbC